MPSSELPIHPPADQEVIPAPPIKPRWWLHIGLFVLTFASVVYASLSFAVPEGAADGQFLRLWHLGLPYAFLLLAFLSAHEFGHYFAARYHGLRATLPFFIPMPISPFGTFGAVIRIRSVIPNRRVLFDIGVAGPIAGFVVALAFLIAGMATMPGIDSLYRFHPQYGALKVIPDTGLHFGDFALFSILKNILIAKGRFFPPMNEIYHYPLVCVGWFGMFVTALNMIPVGQLDGGHVVYAMFGWKQYAISKWASRVIMLIGLGWVVGLVHGVTGQYHPDHTVQLLQRLFGPPLDWIAQNIPWWFRGWPGWIFWGVLMRLVFKIKHPPTPDNHTPLDARRRILGWMALAIFVLTFSYNGIFEIVP